VITRPFELVAIEKSVTNAVQTAEEKLKQSHAQYEGLQADEANLLAKIEKKKQEFERAEKRLQSLQSVR
jgi:clusterin-associated protein 1